MTETDILDAIRLLPRPTRARVVVAALRLLEADLEEVAQTPDWTDQEIQMEEAAKRLLPFYLHDKELTAFTALDGEDFYEYD